MEIKKFLEKIYENYSDFSDFFKKFYSKSPKRDANTSNSDMTIVFKKDLKKEMLLFYKENNNLNNNNSRHSNNQSENKPERNMIKGSKIENYIENFLNLIFDEVKKFKIIRPKKTWRR